MTDKGPEKINAITVLMPVFNAATHLRQAMESILVQTYKNFRFLIIDDASTDESVAIVRSFSDERIQLVCHERNAGIKDTLNEGIELAETELIARMDADDISHPWRLQKQVDYLLSHPNCAMVGTRAKILDIDNGKVEAYDPYKLDMYYGLHFDCYVCHPSVMYRKSCVKEVGKYTMSFAEDYDLWWKLSRLYKIHTLPEPLLTYRRHAKNYSRVDKRVEYDQAEYKIIKRIFYYLLGKEESIPEAYIDCYNYKFEPLIRLKNDKEIRECLDLLETINAAILSIENPNRNMYAISHSAEEKKRTILYGLGLALPFLQMLKLLGHYKYYHLITFVCVKKVKRNLSIKKRVLKEMVSGKRKINLRLLLWNH